MLTAKVVRRCGEKLVPGLQLRQRFHAVSIQPPTIPQAGRLCPQGCVSNSYMRQICSCAAKGLFVSLGSLGGGVWNLFTWTES